MSARKPATPSLVAEGVCGEEMVALTRCSRPTLADKMAYFETAPNMLFEGGGQGMTEAEWLACAKPDKMLNHPAGYSSDRKLRLFAAACCRCVWDYLVDERSRNAVAV
jgi:hypothetical protein